MYVSHEHLLIYTDSKVLHSGNVHILSSDFFFRYSQPIDRSFQISENQQSEAELARSKK